MRYALGIDIGGTNLVVGAVPDDGSAVLGVRTEPTRPDRGADQVIDRIVAMAAATIADARRDDPDAEILGAGIGSPGPLDTKRGVVILTPNLGWTNMPLRDRLAERIELPATLDNDANCALMGEWWIGAARDTRHAVAFTLGTGIGGGLIVDGRLVHGASDVAGEIGHMTIDTNGRRCGCGNDGCLEAYASGPAIARRAAESVRAGDGSALLVLANGDPDQITAQTVFDAAAQGDPIALEVVHDTARYLGAGVASVINLLNPEVVVICGGVTRAGDRLFVPLRREVSRRAFKPAVEACRIVPGELPGTAGVVGAAKIFLDAHA
jgi:glucokinase